MSGDWSCSDCRGLKIGFFMNIFFKSEDECLAYGLDLVYSLKCSVVCELN